MTGDLQLTAQDRTWLDAMDRAMQTPVAMVTGSQYQSVVDSRDAAVRAIYRMRQNRRRMWTRYRKLRGRLFKTECCAAAVLAALVVWKW